MTNLSIFQPLVLSTRQMDLNRWEPGQPLEFSEHLCVPNAREGSAGMETNCHLEPAPRCVLSLRALTEAASAQIHVWVHHRHVAGAMRQQHPPSYCCTSAAGHRPELWPGGRPWELPWGKECGAGAAAWHRQSWLLIPSPTVISHGFTAQPHPHRISAITQLTASEQTAPGQDQDWDIRTWLQVLCFCAGRPSFRAGNVHVKKHNVQSEAAAVVKVSNISICVSTALYPLLLILVLTNLPSSSWNILN